MRRLLVCILLFIFGCREDRPSRPRRDASIERSVSTHLEPWEPARPNWLRLPAQAPPTELAVFEAQANMLERIELPGEEPRPATAEFREAAQILINRLPQDIRWRDALVTGAWSVIEGRIPIVTTNEIEPSSELDQPTPPSFDYDGVRDRIVHHTDFLNPFERRLRLLYALATRAHFEELARLAGVSRQTLASQIRICDNLRAEFALTNAFQATELMSTWVPADPDTRPPTPLTRLNGPYLGFMTFATEYPGFDVLAYSTRPEADKIRSYALSIFSEMRMRTPTAFGSRCSRYVITHGSRRGHYLALSDDVPSIIPALNLGPELLRDPSN